MEIAIIVLAVAATVLAVAALCRRLGLPTPLVLVLVGTVGSFLPFVPTIELTPELVLLGFLPPLLYAAAIRTSLVDIRTHFRSISLLAVGLVVFTMVVVGLVTFWLLPVPLAAALAFGAVVSPPDAVAATAIARRIGLPRRIVTILEGESLLNDATALVALRTASLALAGTVSVGSVSLDFLLKAGGGVAVGLVVTTLIVLLRKRMTDTVSDTLLSFMAPFLAYIPAEEIGASGVIAVVVTGLVLGHKAPVVQDARSRMSERINWNTIQFLLENAVFLLLGLQLRWILEGIGQDDLGPGTVAAFCIGALVATILARPLWVFAGGGLLRGARHGSGQGSVSWQHLAVLSWAGMRGVVTVAAAFLLPASTPHRPTLLLGAFAVTAGTLLVQGLTLPLLARRLGVRGPDRAEDILQQAAAVQEALTAGVAALQRERHPDDPDELIEELLAEARDRTDLMWERLGHSDGEPPSARRRRLRLVMLAAEREELVRLRALDRYDHENIAAVMAQLDVEEAVLTAFAERADRDADWFESEPLAEALVGRPEPGEPAGGRRGGDDTERPGPAPCVHLQQAPRAAPVVAEPVCQGCLRDGTDPVHLRQCLSCGTVGCCDSSVGRHADDHFRRTGHPVMRSIELGETWRWCYVHEALD